MLWKDYLKTRGINVAGMALRECFLRLDAGLRDKVPRGDISGCTACVVLITPGHIICANAGDSRAILRNNGEVEPLSKDHKPTDPQEYARIYAANDFVRMGRVHGALAVARAFGDFDYKKSTSKNNGLTRRLPPEKQPVPTTSTRCFKHSIS